MLDRPCERILAIACGSIHARCLRDYLAPLRQHVTGDIKLVTTSAAVDFIVAEEVEPFVSQILTGFSDARHAFEVPHLELARWAQSVLVIPATANFIGKAANGIADDLASTIVVAARVPVVFAPAMNRSMWQANAIQRNVSQLRRDGHYVIEPIAGGSALDDDQGLGPSPDLVLNHLTHVIFRQLLHDS